MSQPVELPPDVVFPPVRIPDPKAGTCYLIATGPSADYFDGSIIKPEDYVLVVNFAGLLVPRYDAFVALDTHRIGVFDGIYPEKTVLYTIRPRTMSRRYFNCQIFRSYVPGSACSSAAVGICVLYNFGYRKIHAIGFDTRITKWYHHSKKLIDRGLYKAMPREPKCLPLEHAVEVTLAAYPDLEMSWDYPPNFFTPSPSSAGHPELQICYPYNPSPACSA